MSSHPLLAPQIQIFAVAVLLAFLGWICWQIRYHRLSLRDSLGWLLSTGAALVIAVFPELLAKISEAFGVAVPANALFAFAFVYVLLNLLGLTVSLSTQAVRVRRLAQECAILRAELEELRARVPLAHKERSTDEAARR